MSDIQKALNEATSASGGYLVPPEYSNMLLDLVQANSICMDDLDVRQMASNIQYIPTHTGATTAYWVNETSSITESGPLYGQITLTAKKVASLVNASSEVLEDNNVDLANHLVEQMAQDIALAIDSAVFNGTGSPWSGLRRTTIFANAVDASGNVNATAADGTGSSITGGNISLSPIAKAVIEVLKDNHEQPDISYFNPRTYGSVILLTDSTTRPILNQETFGSPLLREGVIGTMYGTRVKVSSQIPVNLTYGTTAALSANCTDALVGRSKKFALLGNRRGFIWKTNYVIASDYYQWQTTGRFAFATKYNDAYCMIRGITN